MSAQLHFGVLAAHCELRGWTFADLARESKVSRLTIHRANAGVRVSASTLRAVAEALEKNPPSRAVIDLLAVANEPALERAMA